MLSSALETEETFKKMQTDFCNSQQILLLRFKEDGKIPRELLLALHSLLGEVLRYLNQRCGSESFYHQAKILRKTLIPFVL
jgi:hypothetical protein